jgi:hypothetical protein
VDIGQVVDGRAQLQRQREPLDDLARSAVDDVDADDASGPRLEDDLVQPVLRVGVLREGDARRRRGTRWWTGTPRSGQLPPQRARSTIATRAPCSCDALPAAARAAEPASIAIRSNDSVFI